MKTIRATQTITAAALALLLAPAFAADPAIPARGPISFQTFDADADNYVSPEEFQRAREQRIQQRSAEGRPMRGMQQAPQFSDIDADGDGRLSEQEVQAHHQQRQQLRMQQGRRGMGGPGSGPGGGQPQ